MKNKLSPIQKVRNFVLNHGENKIKWIRGKWFNSEDNEIKNIDNYLAQSDHGEPYFSFGSVKDIDDWKESFIVLYGDNESPWPLNKIAREGIKREPIYPLAFPLTEKQLEIASIILYHPEEERSIFILAGVGGSGKSTFINIIQQLLNSDFFPANLSDLSNGFILSEAIKHRLICSDELASDDLSSNVLKQLASKQSVTANGKNERPIAVKTQSNMIFSCNRVPKIDLRDSGLYRRIAYLNHEKPISHPNPLLKDKKYSEDELINIASAAYRAYKEDWFKDFEKETDDLLFTNNSVYIAYDHYCSNVNKIVGFGYKYYNDTCRELGLKAFSEPNFQSIKDLMIEHGYIQEELPF